MGRALVTVMSGLLALATLVPSTYAQVSAPPAQSAKKPASPLPVDPWPVQIDLANATVLVYSPQVNSWDGNLLDFRSAVAIKASGTGAETFGVIWATARTQVDRVERTVTLEDFKLVKRNFPALPGNGQAYITELEQRIASDVRTIALDRLQASLAVSGVKPPAVAVQNDPPQIIVSYSPAILVPIAGAPVLKPVEGHTRFEHVINTGAVLVHRVDTWYLHVYDGCLSSFSLSGPWTVPYRTPFGLDAAGRDLAKSGKDLLDGGTKANPKPLLAKGTPTIYTSQVPAELIVFRGQPNLVPVAGTGLLWASNTSADVVVDTSNSNYYVLVSGRWYRAPGLTGPWTYVAANALPAAFAKIPKDSPAGVVLATVAGTTQAREAVIENSIPQTATVPRKNGPTFVPNFDGAPQYQPVTGTPLSYVVNTPYPIIRVDDKSFYAVRSGVWFTATEITGPWVVAISVPAVIYTIPASSPLHYVTYVRIYSYTAQVVYVGYTPGYLGTVITPDGTVVYGTGYAYDPWIGSVWYPVPVTYGIAAAPIYNPAVGFTFGFALGLATSAWATPYWGGAYYHPGYWGAPCCGSATANVYRNWGSGVSSGTRSWYSNTSNIGSAGAGSYANYRTGVSGSYSGYRNYNYDSGMATQGYTRTGTGAAGGTGSVTRSSAYDTNTGQRYYNSSAGVTGAGGSSVDRTASASAGPQGFSRSAQTTTYNATTGETHNWNDGVPAGDNHFGSSSGNVQRNNAGSWQQFSAGGWQGAGSDATASQREQQARSSFESHASSFGGGGGFGGGDRFSGGGGGGGFGGRFSGGFGSRFGGGGFGGGRFRR